MALTLISSYAETTNEAPGALLSLPILLGLELATAPSSVLMKISDHLALRDMRNTLAHSFGLVVVCSTFLQCIPPPSGWSNLAFIMNSELGPTMKHSYVWD
jgi:hypothetical protein